MVFLAVLLGSVFLAWCAIGAFAYWSLRGAPVLRPDTEDDLPEDPPKVSILVPARNEEEILPSSLSSLLKLEYPKYQVILVNDSSTDRTGHIAEAWAARPEGQGKLSVIHSQDLRSGWKGKVHALDVAAKAATGDWLLATDADVIFHPTVLRKAMALALRRDVQLLSLSPECQCNSFWEKAVMPASLLFLLLWYPLRLVNDSRRRRAAASGAFILMRRADFEALGGYEHLRQVILEDIGTAAMFKQGGRRTLLAVSQGLLRTRMYGGWREIWESISRNAFEGVGFSVPRLLLNVILGNLLAFFPWLALLVSLARWLETTPSDHRNPIFWIALAVCVISSLIFLPILKALGVSPWYLLATPLSALVISLASLHSAWAHRVGKGVPWKGRRYT